MSRCALRATWRVNQDQEGIDALISSSSPSLSVSFYCPVPRSAAGIPVAVVNPARFGIRPLLAKTDRIDAAVIAHFGEVSGIVAQPLVPAAARELEALVTRRRQVIQMRTAELQHRQRTLPIVQRRIDRNLAAFEEELRDLDSELTQRLRESPVWREREELLRSVPGIR